MQNLNKMEKKIDNTNAENTDKKLIISDVMRSFTLEDMKKCFLKGFQTHAESYNMSIYEGEWYKGENIFNEWIKNYA